MRSSSLKSPVPEIQPLWKEQTPSLGIAQCPRMHMCAHTHTNTRGRRRTRKHTMSVSPEQPPFFLCYGHVKGTNSLWNPTLLTEHSNHPAQHAVHDSQTPKKKKKEEESINRTTDKSPLTHAFVFLALSPSVPLSFPPALRQMFLSGSKQNFLHFTFCPLIKKKEKIPSEQGRRADILCTCTQEESYSGWISKWDSCKKKLR